MSCLFYSTTKKARSHLDGVAEPEGAASLYAVPEPHRKPAPAPSHVFPRMKQHEIFSLGLLTKF
jgi:hypothetical protein